jgi:hypothetical protein
MAKDTGGQRSWRGWQVCGCVQSSIEDIIEPRLREAGILGSSEKISIFQGCYNAGGVAASAGTHDGGGALDHEKGNDAETIIWRECGVADWQRGSPEDTAFDDHNHGIWQGCPHVSSGADDQIDQYKAGCNGLSGWGPDQSPHVAPITWQDAYDKYAGSTGGGEGIFDMSKSVYERRGTDYVVKAQSDFDDLKINDDDGYTVVSGTTDQVTCAANVQVDDMKAGEYFDICWRIAKYKSGSTTTYSHTRPAARVFCPKDNSMVTVDSVYNGGLPDQDGGYDSRLRLGYKTNSKTAKVVSVVCQGWKSD